MTIFTEMLSTKEEHVVAVSDLALDPKMQMRTEMDHDLIREYAEDIKDWIEDAPIEVVIVETAVREVFYVVDGFHRTHAALAAGLEGIDANVYRADFETAVKYAMSRNFQHGKKATAEDAEKAIKRLMEFAPDFGYDSSQVNKYIEQFIKSSNIRKFTGKWIAEIKAMRDYAIETMAAEGKSQREIADAIGCGQKTVSRVLDESKSSANKMTQEPDLPFLDEDEETCSSTNPADILAAQRAEREQKAIDRATAMNRELSAEAEDGITTPNVHSEVNEIEATLTDFLSRLKANPTLKTETISALIAELNEI